MAKRLPAQRMSNSSVVGRMGVTSQPSLPAITHLTRSAHVRGQSMALADLDKLPSLPPHPCPTLERASCPKKLYILLHCLHDGMAAGIPS